LRLFRAMNTAYMGCMGLFESISRKRSQENNL
jgi:hypothetical protein